MPNHRLEDPRLVARRAAQRDRRRSKAIARAMPAPAIRWLDLVVFGGLLALLRLF